MTRSRIATPILLLALTAACGVRSTEVTASASGRDRAAPTIPSSQAESGPALDRSVSPGTAGSANSGAARGEDADIIDTDVPVDTTAEQIGEACRASRDDSGFGEYHVTGRVRLARSTLRLDVPCRLILKDDARLTFSDVTMETTHLLITDEPGSAGRNVVRLSKVQGVGRDGAAFAMSFNDSTDAIVVADSTLDYQMAVWMRAVGSRPGSEGGGDIRIRRTELTANIPGTEGVQIVASEDGGKLTLQNVNIVTPTVPLLFAGQCRAQRLTGAPEDCGPLP
jgi:hypothetical protein